MKLNATAFATFSPLDVMKKVTELLLYGIDIGNTSAMGANKAPSEK